MLRQVFLVGLLVAVAFASNDEEIEHPWAETASARLTIVTRAQWGARAATSFSNLARPVPNVVIHHTVTPACTTRAACISQMQSMQNHHMNGNGWADIGYNFCVGGDAAVYEGRGWARVGAHATNWNSNSIGIAVIGTWGTNSPPASQLNSVRNLIAIGVDNGSISRTYRLLGHRQAGSTECPGNALQSIIQTWPNWRSEEIDVAQ